MQPSRLLSPLIFILLSSPFFFHPSQALKHDNPRVIIVGAGMSGIMAASTLSMNGITDFVILEATDRIGGRLHQKEFEGYVVEIGANWVEGVGGEKENPIWTLAQQYNITVSYSDFGNVSANTYSQDGTHLPLSTTTPRFDLATASFNYSNALSEYLQASGGDDISILTSQRLFGHIPETPLDMAIDFFNYDFEIAEPPRITSLKNVQPNPTFVYYGDDEYLVADRRGYVHILEQLANEFLEHDDEGITDPRVKLQKVVNRIEYSNDGVTVETEDNSTYVADYVILSVSLGVLKSRLITYKPDLPYWKIKTFYQFDMVIYTKIFLKFPYTFWPTGPGTQFFLYADGTRGYYPFWQHLDKEYPGSNLIFVTVTDDESRRIEQQPENTTKAEIMEVLRKMFGDNIPEPDAILIPRWGSDRFFGGTYLNWPIGVTAADFDRMKAPIGPLYFTGEHTSAQFNGYVHGAYLEGIAVAESLLDCVNHGNCNEITSDGLPWEAYENNTSNANETISCEEIQTKCENIRQVYIDAISVLEEDVEKCK